MKSTANVMVSIATSLFQIFCVWFTCWQLMAYSGSSVNERIVFLVVGLVSSVVYATVTPRQR